MRFAIRMALLAGAVALSCAAQEPPKYQSVAPKKKEAKPADPADVATLTGRPVPESVATRPQPRSAAELANDPKLHSGAALNPDDVDVLTGKYDSGGNLAYRTYGAEGLWTLEWMERNGYGPGASFFRDGRGRYGRTGAFLPGGFGRPFVLHHRRGFARGVFALQHFLRGGTFFFAAP